MEKVNNILSTNDFFLLETKLVGTMYFTMNEMHKGKPWTKSENKKLRNGQKIE